MSIVQGAAFGGGAGLVAASDIAIAGQSAQFCFSEVKLGLIPAVISPYVVKAIGERAAKWLFMSTDVFTAEKAQSLNLVHHVIPDDELETFAYAYAKKIASLAPEALCEAKALVTHVARMPLDKILIDYTAALIAKKRGSLEGQEGIKAFLNKETPNWG